VSSRGGPDLPEPLLIPERVLQQAGRFFEGCGARGLEGTALIAADTALGAQPEGARLVVPQQVPTRTRLGVSVEVTLAGQMQLATALSATEHYVARIHSHPGEAFHSAADDGNPVLTHAGALSIVVPFFGLGLRRGLVACAVLRLAGGRWRDLPPGPERDRWVQVQNTEQLAGGGQ
jgi:hypothetical protein